VIISEAALNYEEGKWDDVDGKPIFLPDYDIIRTPTGDMQAFAESRSVPVPSNIQDGAEPQDSLYYYRYGDFISGAAVRQDAHEIFKNIRSTVSRSC
jgi:hypothetical protein